MAAAGAPPCAGGVVPWWVLLLSTRPSLRSPSCWGTAGLRREDQIDRAGRSDLVP
jgi:hypothetical protein